MKSDFAGISISGLLVILLSVPALAASTTHQGAMPKGKAFVEISGQIAQVKLDVSELQTLYIQIITRVESQGTDLQGQIDALNGEVAALQAQDAVLLSEIDTIAAQAEQNNYDLMAAVAQMGSLQGQIDTLTASSGDNTADIAALEAQLEAVQADVAANAEGLLAALADLQMHGDLIGMLQSNIADLQRNMAELQEDIGASCPEGFYVFGVLDDGTLQCAIDDATTTVEQLMIWSPQVDLDNSSHAECALWWDLGPLGQFCLQWISVQDPGDKWVQATCPVGFRATGGGWHLNSHVPGTPWTGYPDDLVAVNYRSYHYYVQVYFDNQNPGDTEGRHGYAIANCQRVN
jgi:hypothetical protein